MRTILVFLFLAVFFIVTFPAYLILLLLRKKNRLLSSKIAQKFVGFNLGWHNGKHYDLLRRLKVL